MIYTVTLNPALDRTIYVDSLRVSESNRIRREERFAGGKGIDVSRALVELGTPSVALGLVGGFDGKELEGRLTLEGVDCRFTRISGETRTNIIIQDIAANSETALLARGPTVGPHELMDFIALLESLPDLDFAVISGSLPPGLTPAVYRRIIEIATLRGARVLLDTSGDGLQQGILARPTVIKPNRAELAEFAGRAFADIPDIVRYCRTLLDRVATVLVSLGAEGIVLVQPGRALHARPPQVEVKSTVGAGDCSVAGFVHGLVKNLDETDCLRWAVAAGTAATLCPGTGLCRRPDIDGLLPRVAVAEVTA
uniref:1-phosphofructokinase n=1 Tax=candidate division WOR-3 bacterium TaxID=2052148 RepID=A0A7C4GE78_UNCW3